MMIRPSNYRVLVVLSALCCQTAFAEQPHHPAYFGVIGGVGSTAWRHLVSEDVTTLIAMATPIAANDTGMLWGFLAGYRFAPHFALESTYVHFPRTYVQFLDYSFYSPIKEISSQTSVYTLVGKFISPTPLRHVEAYADAGLSVTERRDALSNKHRAGAAFGFGLLHPVGDNFMSDLSFQFQTGYAISEMRPAANYIPFLISGQLRLSYRFDLFSKKA